MDFDFSAEQYQLRDAFRELLSRESTPTAVRRSWQEGTVDAARWRQLGEMGVLGLNIPESAGGAGMDEVDMVLLLEESGRHVLPEPFLEHAALAAPLLNRAGTDALRAKWLPRLADGSARATLALEGQPAVVDADADLVLIEQGGELHAATQDRLTLQPLSAWDGARRMSRVTAELDGETLLGPAAEHHDWAFNHAAAGAAAQLVGVAGAMLDLTIAYAKERMQFGQRIGEFQAVQHQLAESFLLVESSKAAVYYAAYALAHDDPEASIHVSVAKAYAGDAERRANHVALQIHGGIGFTSEHDLHLWLKRGRALESVYGDSDWHRRRIADWIYAKRTQQAGA